MIKPGTSLFAEHKPETRRTLIGDPLLGSTRHVDFEALAASIDDARRLMRAGVPTELHGDPGAGHGFYAIAPDAAVARQHWHAVLAALRRAFFLATRNVSASGSRWRSVAAIKVCRGRRVAARMLLRPMPASA